MAYRSIRTIALPALALASATLLAACASGPRTPSTWQGARTHMTAMDKNDDGVLAREEINPELALYQEFDRYDVDGSGVIEQDEFYQYINDREGQN
jgi:Ca2+-binding EF-hand superfamily protein